MLLGESQNSEEEATLFTCGAEEKSPKRERPICSQKEKSSALKGDLSGEGLLNIRRKWGGGIYRCFRPRGGRTILEEESFTT